MENIEQTQVEVTEAPAEVVSEPVEQLEQVVESPEAVSETAPESHRNPKIEKRIAKMTAKLAAMEEENQRLRQQVEGKAPPVQDNKKPVYADYADTDSYVEAMAEWKFAQKLAEVEQNRTAQKVVNSYNERVSEVVRERPDYPEAVQEIYQHIDRDAEQFILESEVGPKIILALSDNDEELARFTKMSKARKLAYLANLETTIQSPKKAPVQNTPLAPAPVAKVKQNTTAEPVTPSNEIGTYEEWVRKRNQSLKRK